MIDTELQRRHNDVAKLAEKLMGDLASLLDLYKTATFNHPDDDVRILTIGHMEASILKARRVLYGETNDGP